MSDLRVYNPNESAFASYLRTSDEKPKLARAIADEIKALGLTGRRVIADIGCHEGRLLGLLLDELGDLWDPRGLIHCIDPNARALEVLAHKFESKPYRLELHPLTASEFLEKNGDFLDVALAAHSLYWESDLRATVEKIAAASGTVFLVVNEGEGFLPLRREFEPELSDRGFHLHTGQSILGVLRAFGLAPRAREITCHVPIPTGDDFLDFAGFVLQLPRSAVTESHRARLHALVGDRPNLESHSLLITCTLQGA